MGFLGRMASHVGHAVQAVAEVLVTVPQIPQELSRVFSLIIYSGPPWLQPTLPLAVAASIALLVLAAPRLLDRLTATWLQRRAATQTRLGRTLLLIVFDVVALLITIAIAAVLVHFLFPRQFLIGKFAVTLVGAAVRWRLTMLAIEILLRPSHSELRLVLVDDAKARLAVRWVGVVLAFGTIFITILPVLLEAGLDLRSAQGMALVVGTLMAVGGAYGVNRLLDGLHSPAAFVGQSLIILLWIAWSVGVTMRDFDVYHGLVWSLCIIAAVAGIDRLLALATEAARASTEPSSGSRLLVITTLRRIVRAVSGTVVAGLVTRLWLVDILSVVDWETWKQVRGALVTALGVLVVGYVAYELLRAWTQAKFGPHHGGATTLPGDDQVATPTTRLASVLPVLQGVLGALIIAIAILLALSHLGINVAPLIAGAGIFGLAISFGSQALVRDIVAGLFYMLDDAFRVGEYIAAGNYKGTVERIALRSVRVRHQNGQIHTLPYGQLGAVTNFSRDYATIKFNLRLARDTDLDKVRKLAKKIGQELLDHPELGGEFIAPLKMQGIADIQENALVCRFKFTVRPAKPTLAQREATKRLYLAFIEQGIVFASNAILVQSSPDSPAIMSAAAQVAKTTAARGSNPGT